MNITIVSLWAQKLFRKEEPQPFGGAELQLVLLARELVKLPGVNVRFITRGQGSWEKFESNGIEVHKLPYRTNRYTRSLLGFRDCLKECRNIPSDVYIQRGGGFETGITGHVAHNANKPFLFMTSHTWDVDGTHEKERGFLYGRVFMYGFNRASSIINQTDHQHDLLRKNYNRTSLVFRSAHPIPPELPEKREGVLWVGRCEPFKNPGLFLDLVAKMPEIPCTMVCPPANLDDMFVAIKNKADSLANLRFLPGVPFDETERLFASHRIMVNTSTQEGYPNTYVQSFKWGVPVITALFDPDDIIERHSMGLRAGDDVEAMKQAVMALLSDNERWNIYSRNARTFACEQHDAQKIAARLYAHLQEIIERHHQ